LVGAVGIELKVTLKARKLLIPLNAKNTEFAQVRYTAGTRTETNCPLGSVILGWLQREDLAALTVREGSVKKVFPPFTASRMKYYTY
jgi:hypothetical protein